MSPNTGYLPHHPKRGDAETVDAVPTAREQIPLNRRVGETAIIIIVVFVILGSSSAGSFDASRA
jgi:hypothetical protein